MAETKDITKEYSNGETTVLWQPGKCIHSGICLKGLPKVFNLRQKPWVNMEGATTEEIIDLVHKCPSGALTIKDEPAIEDQPAVSHDVNQIKLIKKGPVIVEGDAEVTDEKGEVTHHKKAVAFCRCNLSEKMPYCDGSHVKQFQRPSK